MSDTPLLPPPASEDAHIKTANSEAAAYGTDYKAYCSLLLNIQRFRDRYEELSATQLFELTACEIKVFLTEAYLEATRKNKKASVHELAEQAKKNLAAFGLGRLRRDGDAVQDPLLDGSGLGGEAPADEDREDITLSESEEAIFGKIYRAAARLTHEDATIGDKSDRKDQEEPAIVLEAQLALQGYSAPALFRRLAEARKRGNFLETSALSIFIHWATGKSVALLSQLGLTPAMAVDLLQRARTSLGVRRQRRLQTGIGLLYASYCTPDDKLVPTWEQRVVSHFQTLISSQNLRLEYLVQCALDLGQAHRQAVDALLQEVSS